MSPFQPYINPLPGKIIVILVIAAVWTLLWKGYALWTAVKNNHKKWFVALLVLNTLGILEIFYIFHIAKKKWADVRNALTRIIS